MVMVIVMAIVMIGLSSLRTEAEAEAEVPQGKWATLETLEGQNKEGKENQLY
jgi:hypothetical protein